MAKAPAKERAKESRKERRDSKGRRLVRCLRCGGWRAEGFAVCARCAAELKAKVGAPGRVAHCRVCGRPIYWDDCMVASTDKEAAKTGKGDRICWTCGVRKLLDREGIWVFPCPELRRRGSDVRVRRYLDRLGLLEESEKVEVGRHPVPALQKLPELLEKEGPFAANAPSKEGAEAEADSEKESA